MNVSDLIDPSFSYRLIATLMHFLWQGCLVALLAVLGDGLLSRASASRRYALHVAALAIMVACVAVTFSQIEVPASGPAVSVASIAKTTVADPAFPRHEDVDPSSIPSTTTPAFVVVELPLPESPPVAVPGAAVESPIVRPERLASDGERWQQLQRWAPQIAALYFVCCGLLLARLVRGIWVAHRLRRRAITVSDDSLIATFYQQSKQLGLRVLPRIAWCAEVSIPLVIGVLEPMILLPAAAATGLSPDQLQALITHELAHIRRYDLLVNLVQRVVESMLFFHPAVWFISRRISNEREQACDELVLATGCERLRYADALVRMAELSSSLRCFGTSAPATSLAAAGANSSEFKRRVLKVLSVPTASHLRPSRFALLLVLVGLIFGVSLMPTRFPYSVFAQTQQPKTGHDVSNDSASSTEKTPKDADSTKSSSVDWGEPANGLRSRVVPVLSSMSEDAVDLAQRVTEFETLDDVGLAVEIENVSDKPVSLRELRYGTNYGEASGTLASDWFGQFLFSIDYFDADGKPIEQPELIPVGKELGMSGDAQTSTLEPKQTIKMLLRPNRWISVLSQQPLVGKQRAVIRYRGAVADKAVEIVAPAAEFSVKKRGYRPSGAPSPQLGDDRPISFTRGGAAKLITTTASVTDASANFANGSLTLALVGSDGTDELSIKTSATVTIANVNEVFVSGIKIGTFTGGTNNTNFVVTLTSNANSARLTALLKAMQFATTTAAASPNPRTLQATLSDGLGGESTTFAKTINII